MAAPARGTTRARSRGSSAIAAGTSWCRCQGSGTSMSSTRILKPAAPSDGRNNCVATQTVATNAWNGIVRFFSAFPGNRLRRLRQAPGAGQFAVAGALSRHRLLRPHTVRPLRGAGPRLCPRGGHQLRRRGDCQAPAFEQEDSSSIRCTICPCWSKRPTRWIRRLPWPAGCCRRCSAISAAYLKRGWAKLRPGAAANRELLPRRCSSRHIGGAGARRDRLRCGQAPGAVPDREAAATLLLAHPYRPRAEVATTSARSYMGLLKGAAP